MKGNIRKIIFWYLASASMQSKPAGQQLEHGEDFNAIWVSFESLTTRLTFDDDKVIAKEALKAIQMEI